MVQKLDEKFAMNIYASFFDTNFECILTMLINYNTDEIQVVTKYNLFILDL